MHCIVLYCIYIGNTSAKTINYWKGGCPSNINTTYQNSLNLKQRRSKTAPEASVLLYFRTPESLSTRIKA